MHDFATQEAGGQGHDHGHRHDVVIPRIVLRALLGVILFTVAAVLVARATGVGLMLTPEAAPVETRLLQFDEARGGDLIVTDHATGGQVALFDASEGGFIRGVLRGLTRGRALGRMEETDVYLLTRWDDGRLSISDPATGDRFDLNSFGVDNLGVFAQLLVSQGRTE
jgi:putative photosynthetic complex assembly protein